MKRSAYAITKWLSHSGSNILLEQERQSVLYAASIAFVCLLILKEVLGVLWNCTTAGTAYSRHNRVFHMLRTLTKGVLLPSKNEDLNLDVLDSVWKQRDQERVMH